jgi:xanthine dehydrogenase molybdopterin-binding subunit B
MAEVKVDPATGVVKVVRIVCAQDMGIVVNPEGAKMQIEGGITMGLGYTLARSFDSTAATFSTGISAPTRFHTSPGFPESRAYS